MNMATVGERLAVTETKIAQTAADVAEIKADVKLLLASRAKFKGASAVIAVVASAVTAGVLKLIYH
jgi:hypothetical protein